ncbi:MAG TPA: flagellar biosynthetic protein FliR [Acidimicrobiales bacterium]|nr:flagellar biosynthetic protein FliR [Acidimicrobiales bacterium]
MEIQLAAGSFFVFMFALVRATAWLSFAPPFSSQTIPAVVRLGLAASLALAVTPTLGAARAGSTGAPFSSVATSLGTGGFITELVVQAVIGALLGFMTSLLLSIVSSAGALTDMTSGLSAATTFDPISGTSNPVTANVFNLLLTTLLFATGGYLLIVKGFMLSFQSVGLSARSMSLIGPTLVSEIGFFFAAAVEIAAPVLGCMFLAFVALGLLNRSAPQLNIMSLGFALNIALAIIVVGVSLPLLPGAVNTIVERVVNDTLGLMGVKP